MTSCYKIGKRHVNFLTDVAQLENPCKIRKSAWKLSSGYQMSGDKELSVSVEWKRAGKVMVWRRTNLASVQHSVAITTTRSFLQSVIKSWVHVCPFETLNSRLRKLTSRNYRNIALSYGVKCISVS